VVDVAELMLPQPAVPSHLTYPSQLMRVPQMAMDDHQLAIIASDQDVIATALPAPIASMPLT
jgi:hypothetical protein